MTQEAVIYVLCSKKVTYNSPEELTVKLEEFQDLPVGAVMVSKPEVNVWSEK